MQELALHVLDLIRNAAEAGARTVWVTVREDTAADVLQIEVRDDGRGMTPAEVQAVLDPFYTTRTTRRVGLGLSLLHAAAEAAGGGLEVESEVGRGTRVRAHFRHSHIDRAPLGDMAATLEVGVADESVTDLHYEHWLNGCCFRFSTEVLEDWLGPGARREAAVLAWVYRYIEEGEKMLRNGDIGRWSQGEIPGGSGPAAR